MLSFESDYIEGAHPLILECLARTNMQQLTGYGMDELCKGAKEKIIAACGLKNADVFLLSGGTQTNQLVISSLLKSYEGVIAAETGHVNVHEAGAIEYSGHKVLALPSHNGKLCPKEVKSYLALFHADQNNEHMVFPGMVYISFPTELGTLYSKAELAELHSVCREYGIPLYIDGARLGYGLASREQELSLPEFARLCDVFYIGGTKVGALIGEALVFPKGDAPERFNTMIKQHGAMLAKGRIIGAQFDTLFTDDLYFKISRHAIDMAEKLKALFKEKGYRFFIDSPTNQQFFVMDDERIAELSKKVAFSFWERVDEGHSAVRFVTSWATKEESIDELSKYL
ncbi:MAG: low specificity L-threonine aldolase [Clostridia bacterium]|nr:low specificity L-threonine aldolase [Clostridia bacterium]